MPDGSRAVAPAWMFDRAACALLSFGKSRCSVGALRDLRRLLDALGFVAAPRLAAGPAAEDDYDQARSDPPATPPATSERQPRAPGAGEPRKDRSAPGATFGQLLLGLKGTMSELELTLMRRRLVEGAQAKAKRGEFRIPVPMGYLWSLDTGLEMDPDRRIQDAIRTVFRLFSRFESARQVYQHMCREGMLFPRPAEAKRTPGPIRWIKPSYRNIISVLQNSFYAGACAYGKSTCRTTLVEGRLTKSYGHPRSMSAWTVLLRDHHAGYVTWADFESCPGAPAAQCPPQTGGCSQGRTRRPSPALGPPALPTLRPHARGALHRARYPPSAVRVSNGARDARGGALHLLRRVSTGRRHCCGGAPCRGTPRHRGREGRPAVMGGDTPVSWDPQGPVSRQTGGAPRLTAALAAAGVKPRRSVGGARIPGRI